jgi:RluA family pseudouridine synthase
MIRAPFQILYEEGPCLAVSKPPGLLTQAPPGIDSLEVRIRALLRRRDGIEGRVYLGVVHRLDRPASGAIVFGTTRAATRRLAQQFEARTVEKRYWVCVEGKVGPSRGTWKDHLRKVPDEPRAEVVPGDHPEGRRAMLEYRTLGVAFWGTLLEIQLGTGRTHQIRVQAASRGHPVLGDAQYGSTTPFGPQYADPRLRAIALHARTLAFDHPQTRKPVTITAPLGLAWWELGLGLDE